MIPDNCNPEPGVCGMEKPAAYTMESQRSQQVLPQSAAVLGVPPIDINHRR